MLIVFAGLPGTGKTTVAQALARKLAAVYLRIDTLEQALISLGSRGAEMGPAGYRAAYAVAQDNLRLGLSVVADAVNSLRVTREAWRRVAREAGVPIVEIELVCLDAAMHRLRVEGRRADIADHALPTWQNVLEREREFDAWESERLVLDTAVIPVEQAVEKIIHHMSLSGPGRSGC
ncbi:AAA family ATPase [Paraburkholderia bonniea]|uniref:AAA family ATPase n=1 Tax=Paraburkholderia bonniea TaxID=2152891 RepID=UPI0012912467|nr:AAA family ATPase [Paraburkholderia bonniea]